METIDNVIIIDYSDIKRSADSNAAHISENTMNTWQRGRGQEEKKADTELGKLAEDAVITALENLHIKNYHSYDNFRSDGFTKHAPFDGVFVENMTQKISNLINQGVEKEGSKLSAETRNKLRLDQVFTVEVKSTRLTQKYREKAGFTSYSDMKSIEALVQSLLQSYDFITYPFFTRYGDMTYLQYCMFAEKRLNTGKTGNELKEHIREIELDNADDIYIRVFMDEENSKALVMGWIDRVKLFSPPETKKLVLPGKSEVPLYFAKSLVQGESLKTISQIFDKKTND